MLFASLSALGAHYAGVKGRAQCECVGSKSAAVLDRLRAMRRPRESHSDVVLRLIQLEAIIR